MLIGELPYLTVCLNVIFIFYGIKFITFTNLGGIKKNILPIYISDSSQWFILSSSDNSVTLEVNGSIPSQVIESNHQLLFTIVASKIGATPGETVISIELPKGILLFLLGN